LKGLASNDFITLDSMEGDDLTEAVENSFLLSVQNMMNSFDFQKTPLKIGDVFQQKIPIIMNILGKPMNLSIEVNYTFQEVNDGNAIITMNHFVRLKDPGNNDIKVSGNGTGKMIFDISENYIIGNESQIIIHSEGLSDGHLVKSINKSTTNSFFKVSEN
jgi:hypothetical protein